MGRCFSLEMKSKDYLNKINIHEGHDGVLLEGNLGNLKQLLFIDSSQLELKCTNGVLRFDVKKSEILTALNKEEVILISE